MKGRWRMNAEVEAQKRRLLLYVTNLSAEQAERVMPHLLQLTVLLEAQALLYQPERTERTG